MSWVSQVKFWLLVIPSIPSAVCSILIVLYFYRQRNHLSLHQHLTLVLIIISLLQILTDFPFALIYYHYEEVVPASNIFCLWWNWWDYSLSGLLVFMMAWGSIDRHLLIFHSSLVSTRRKRMIFHLLPMLICCSYPVIFYFAVIILNTCENEWDYGTLLCLQSCYLIAQPVLGIYDFLANIVFELGLIILANTALIFRVWWQKRNRHEALRRQRKLAVQLLTISAVYIVFFLPMTINGLLYTFTQSSTFGDLQGTYLLYLPYLIPICLPFISLPFLSDFKRIVFRTQPNTIAPGTILHVRPPPPVGK